jgi:hypothetical protein
MRIGIKALAVLAIGAASFAASNALAADMGVTVKRHHAHHRHHVRVVRDYDGAPIALHPRPDGTVDAIYVQRATPTHYLNGEPVRAGDRIVVEY